MPMSGIMPLPPELLEQVYHYLSSIDDVHSFAKTCKATFHVIQRSTVYIEIMRSVIGRAPQHRFDIALSRILDLHRDVVQHFTNGSALPPTQPNAFPHGGITLHPLESQLVSAVTIECPNGPCTDCLSDARCYEILARYQGMRFLENEWLARQLNDNDLLPVDSLSDEDDFLRMYNIIIERDQDIDNGGHPTHSPPEPEAHNSFNADQRSRFYSAIASIWLLNEIRWVLAQFTYTAPSFVLQIRLLETCKDWVANRSAMPLLDELDRYAVFRFMYHHLMVVHGSFLADRCSSKLPLTFPSGLDKNPVYCTRFLQLFLAAGQTYLQPPDLIDLIVRSKMSRKFPYPLLTIPTSSESWQRPSLAFTFPSDLDYTTPNPAHRPTPRLLMTNMVIHLNIISRATINQTESHPQTRWVTEPESEALFKIVDESATYLKEKVMVRFEMNAKRVWEKEKLEDIRTVFNSQWPDVWWSVWWWANSEEKARAKMERWRVKKGT